MTQDNIKNINLIDTKVNSREETQNNFICIFKLVDSAVEKSEVRMGK